MSNDGFLAERPLPASEVSAGRLQHLTRRDLLSFGAGAIAALAGGGWLLPQATLGRLGVHRHVDSPWKEWFLNKALRIDDDVAEAFVLEQLSRAHLQQVADYAAQEQLQRIDA